MEIRRWKEWPFALVFLGQSQWTVLLYGFTYQYIIKIKMKPLWNNPSNEAFHFVVSKAKQNI